MKHPIGTLVMVTSAADDTMDKSFLNMVGEVISHNANRLTGNTAKDPLHLVAFPMLNTVKYESFWEEELTDFKDLK